jgi:hypothetical protein
MTDQERNELSSLRSEVDTLKGVVNSLLGLESVAFLKESMTEEWHCWCDGCGALRDLISAARKPNEKD